jgi:D-alanine-D-alanine ligase
MPVRVAIVCNDPQPSPADEHWIWRSASGSRISRNGFRDASEYGVLEETRVIERYLAEAGYATTIFPVTDVEQLLRFLQQERPDVIFNCCESFRGNAAGEMNVAAMFELAGIAYTGSPALTLGIALNKGIAKALFRAHGVPTPEFAIFDGPPSPETVQRLTPPLIVKPTREDASIGIDEGAIVYDHQALERRVQFVLDHFHQPALVEEFIDGREMNAALLATPSQELVALPISEIIFGEMPEGSPRIVSYEAKWLPNSKAYDATVPHCPAAIDPALADSIRTIALNAARAVGLRDYGRIDLRVRDKDNAAFVLEANPNPDITAESGMVVAARAHGLSHAGMIREILQRALERSSKSA